MRNSWKQLWVATPKSLAGVCTSLGDFVSRAGFSPLLYTAGSIVRLCAVLRVLIPLISTEPRQLDLLSFEGETRPNREQQVALAKSGNRDEPQHHIYLKATRTRSRRRFPS